MNILRQLLVCASAALLVVAGAATAMAKPHTALLAPLTTDLKARLAVLKTQTDAQSLVRKEFVKAALKDLKDPSKSVADDLKILKNVARKIELGYGTNDAGLIAALDLFVVRVTADRDAAVAKLPTVVKAQSEADARDLLDDATTAIGRVVLRPAELDTVKLRADLLRNAARFVASASAKIKSGSACDPRTFGSMRLLLDGASERPTFGHATFTHSAASGDLQVIYLQGYWYDPKAADPYQRGAYDVTIAGGSFHGVGTYTVGTDAAFGRVEHGNVWTGQSGTVEVTSYDAAKRRIAGRFEGTLRNFGTGATAEVTSGYFTYCAWTKSTVSPKR